MTDELALFEDRWSLALETLDDANKIHSSAGSPRSVVNRAYYAMFYATLALFVKCGTSVRTSKHSTIIGVFDTEFMKSGKLPRELSRMLHRAFDDRQEFDYKDYARVENADAEDILIDAKSFISQINGFLNPS
jgi:uncharacterized protein (UPF0332 family)